MRRFVAGLALGLAVGTILTVKAQPFTPDDVYAAIDEAAANNGVSAARLTRVVGCETGRTFNPYAEGDYRRGIGPTSFGAVQLHRGGNAWPACFDAGYSDPNDPYQAVDFLARALRGEFPQLGWWTWSCR